MFNLVVGKMVGNYKNKNADKKNTNMIEDIFKNKEKYFWSKSEDGTIIVGGSNQSRFYGQIKIKLTDEKVIIGIEISNGATTIARKLPDIEYVSPTFEYLQYKKRYEEIGDYLNKDEIKFNQDINRIKLLQNVFDLLPKYND